MSEVAMRSEEEIRKQLECTRDAYQQRLLELGKEDLGDYRFVNLKLSKAVLEWVLSS